MDQHKIEQLYWFLSYYSKNKHKIIQEIKNSSVDDLCLYDRQLRHYFETPKQPVKSKIVETLSKFGPSRPYESELTPNITEETNKLAGLVVYNLNKDLDKLNVVYEAKIKGK